MRQIEYFHVKHCYYINSPDGLIAMAIGEGSGTPVIYYICKDHLGSITGIMNSTGEMLEEYNYDAWGRRRSPVDWSYSNISEPYYTNRGYTGHEHLDMFELINTNGRIYDPVISRFLSPDPFIQDPYNLLNYNRYTYCLNNPLKYTDPSGYNFLKRLFGFFKNRSNKEGNQNSESTSYDDEQGGGWMPVGTGFNYVPQLTLFGGIPVITGIDRYGGRLSDVVVQGYRNNFNFNYLFVYRNNAITFSENPYPSGQGANATNGGGSGLSLSDGNTGLGFVAGASAIELGNKLNPFRPIRYNNGSLLRQGTITRNLNSGALMSGSRYLQTARGALYWTGAGAGVFGVGLSTYNYINGDISGAKYGANMFFGVVGFMGPPGLMISTTYFIVTSPGFQLGVRDYQETKARDFGPGGDWEHLNSNFFYNGGLCFVGGTKVTMGDGSFKPIEYVTVGDTVLTYDFKAGSIISAEVSKTDVPIHNNLIQISFSNETININTQDHPYFVKGKGWSSFNSTQSSERYSITTFNLEVGDKCFVYQKGKLKKVKVTSIKQQEGAVKTYNLTGLKVGNSYFANGILVNSENPIQNKVVEESKKGNKE